jgi:hypothetical protein
MVPVRLWDVQHWGCVGCVGRDRGKGDAVRRVEVTIIDSNCAAFPIGSHAWAREEYDQLTELAGYSVEDVIYSLARERVEVRTALGYQFTISIADYHRLMSE